MSATGLRIGAPAGWRGWLLDPAPGSRRQARFGRWYRGWLGLRRNGPAMTGLVIVLALVLVAFFVPPSPRRCATGCRLCPGRIRSAPTSWAATSMPALFSAAGSR
jgi:peptide/nickel transport system permease protein